MITNLPVLIQGQVFVQSPLIKPEKGQIVLDTKDGCWGTISLIHDKDHVAVSHGFATEVGVPIGRLRKLTEINPNDN